jgi:hypothetical protein
MLTDKALWGYMLDRHLFVVYSCGIRLLAIEANKDVLNELLLFGDVVRKYDVRK